MKNRYSELYNKNGIKTTKKYYEIMGNEQKISRKQNAGHILKEKKAGINCIICSTTHYTFFTKIRISSIYLKIICCVKCIHKNTLQLMILIRTLLITFISQKWKFHGNDNIYIYM